MGTLMHERGTFGAGLQIVYRRNMERLIEWARTARRNGRPATEDPILRQKLAQCYAEIEIMRCNQMRAFSRISATGVPGPEGSIQKIFWSELEPALPAGGPGIDGTLRATGAGDDHAIDKGMWAYGYLRSRAIRSKRARPRFREISSGILCWGCRRFTKKQLADSN